MRRAHPGRLRVRARVATSRCRAHGDPAFDPKDISAIHDAVPRRSVSASSVYLSRSIRSRISPEGSSWSRIESQSAVGARAARTSGKFGTTSSDPVRQKQGHRGRCETDRSCDSPRRSSLTSATAASSGIPDEVDPMRLSVSGHVPAHPRHPAPRRARSDLRSPCTG